MTISVRLIDITGAPVINQEIVADDLAALDVVVLDLSDGDIELDNPLRRVTDANGEAEFPYTGAPTSATFRLPYATTLTVTVSAADTSLAELAYGALSGDPIETCIVTGIVHDRDGQPMAGRRISFYLDVPATVAVPASDGSIVVAKRVQVVSGDAGEFSIPLIKSNHLVPNTTQIRLEVRTAEGRASLSFRVPNTDTADLRNIMGAPEPPPVDPPPPPPPADTTPPTISNVQVANVTENSATITWTTNEASDSAVEYSTDLSYSSVTPVDANPVTSHSITVSGLTPDTLYNMRVRSRDAALNTARSSNIQITPYTNAITNGVPLVDMAGWEAKNDGGTPGATAIITRRTDNVPGGFSASFNVNNPGVGNYVGITRQFASYIPVQPATAYKLGARFRVPSGQTVTLGGELLRSDGSWIRTPGQNFVGTGADQDITLDFVTDADAVRMLPAAFQAPSQDIDFQVTGWSLRTIESVTYPELVQNIGWHWHSPGWPEAQENSAAAQRQINLYADYGGDVIYYNVNPDAYIVESHHKARLLLLDAAITATGRAVKIAASLDTGIAFNATNIDVVLNDFWALQNKYMFENKFVVTGFANVTKYDGTIIPPSSWATRRAAREAAAKPCLWIMDTWKNTYGDPPQTANIVADFLANYQGIFDGIHTFNTNNTFDHVKQKAINYAAACKQLGIKYLDSLVNQYWGLRQDPPGGLEPWWLYDHVIGMFEQCEAVRTIRKPWGIQGLTWQDFSESRSVPESGAVLNASPSAMSMAANVPFTTDRAAAKIVSLFKQSWKTGVPFAFSGQKLFWGYRIHSAVALPGAANRPRYGTPLSTAHDLIYVLALLSRPATVRYRVDGTARGNTNAPYNWPAAGKALAAGIHKLTLPFVPGNTQQLDILENSVLTGTINGSAIQANPPIVNFWNYSDFLELS